MNSQETTVSVGTTDTIVLPSNPKRTCLTLSNLGANIITVKFGAAAALTDGTLVPITQIPVRLDYWQLGARLRESLHGIAATGATALHVIEAFE